MAGSLFALFTLENVVFFISLLYFKFYIQPLECDKGKHKGSNPSKGPILKTITIASKRRIAFVWIFLSSMKWVWEFFFDKKSENIDSYKHW